MIFEKIVSQSNSLVMDLFLWDKDSEMGLSYSKSTSNPSYLKRLGKDQKKQEEKWEKREDITNIKRAINQKQLSSWPRSRSKRASLDSFYFLILHL